eukprot:s2867_g12.t1
MDRLADKGEPRLLVASVGLTIEVLRGPSLMNLKKTLQSTQLRLDSCANEDRPCGNGAHLFVNCSLAPSASSPSFPPFHPSQPFKEQHLRPFRHAMACCSTSGTPLAHYARGLAHDNCDGVAEALPMSFPMYTVRLEVLLEMVEVKAHEDLKAEGKLVEFHEQMGQAAFVSHQWVSKGHPDPDCRQLRFLQDALRNIISTVNGTIPKDLVTEAFVPTAKGIPTRDFRSRPLFLWYDYFSCPQLEAYVSSIEVDRELDPMDQSISMQLNHTTNSRLGRAVDSIPAYIARCAFFFVLCPVIESADGHHILSPSSWAQRGWCRAERTIRELSQSESYIIIKSSKNLETVATPMTSFGGSPGEGTFTLKVDRRKLCPIVKQAIKRKLFSYLQAQNLSGFRALLNLQRVHLRGFNTDVLSDVVPGFPEIDGPDSPELQMARFLFQNGFQSINELDTLGWRPLHYAAMNGEPSLLQALLERRATLDSKTKKQNPYTGIPQFMTALSISLFFKNHLATQFLLEKGANTTSGLIPPVDFASMANNAEGLRMLRSTFDSGDIPDRTGIFAFSSFEVACSFGSMEVIEELLLRETEISKGLHFAMVFRGGTAKLVNRLIQLRADVNQQWKEPFWTFHGIYNHIQALQYRMGKRTTSTVMAYHIYGATPLMNAVLSGQYEGAATLIAAGARLDLRNARKRSVADFADEISVPEFLSQALQGDPEACHRIAMAADDDVFEI